MIKFAVGIPSLNEANNIANLTNQVDEAARNLGIDICIINSDNSSEDGTSEIFLKTETSCPKVGIVTKGKGKGENVFSIFDHVASSKEIEFCFLIDADIVSFNKNWLEEQYAKYTEGIDYVLPQYKRKYIEGNATNHFAYPMMRYLLDGAAPRQPIAGDVGLSRGLIRHLLKQDRNEAAYGYGIDMFISIHALYFDGKISEISLDQKIHSPSFSKMIRIFQEEASAFYFARQSGQQITASFIGSEKNTDFLDSSLICDSDLNKRMNEARELLSVSNDLIGKGANLFKKEFITEDEWADVLAEHELIINNHSADELSMSVTPYYLLRAVSYLRTANSPKEAQKIIDRQADLICKIIKDRVKK